MSSKSCGVMLFYMLDNLFQVCFLKVEKQRNVLYFCVLASV